MRLLVRTSIEVEGHSVIEAETIAQACVLLEEWPARGGLVIRSYIT